MSRLRRPQSSVRLDQLEESVQPKKPLPSAEEKPSENPAPQEKALSAEDLKGILRRDFLPTPMDIFEETVRKTIQAQIKDAVHPYPLSDKSMKTKANIAKFEAVRHGWDVVKKHFGHPMNAIKPGTSSLSSWKWEHGPVAGMPLPMQTLLENIIKMGIQSKFPAGLTAEPDFFIEKNERLYYLHLTTTTSIQGILQQMHARELFFKALFESMVFYCSGHGLLDVTFVVLIKQEEPVAPVIINLNKESDNASGAYMQSVQKAFNYYNQEEITNFLASTKDEPFVVRY